MSMAVHEGSPASYIVSLAKEHANTLVAMATHGRSGLNRLVLGSVTDKVLRTTTVPLLVVRPREEDGPPTQAPSQAPLVRIVVPLDGSRMAEQALPHAITLARHLDVPVVLARVAPGLAEIYRFAGYAAEAYTWLPPYVVDDAVQEAKGYLGSVAERLHNEGIAEVEEQVLVGDAAGSLTAFAQERAGTLVVMTTHGRSGVNRWVLGSVADRVVRTSGEPVLLVRAHEEASATN